VLLAVAACNAPSEQKAAPPPAREVEVLTVEKKPVRETGDYLGSVISRQSVNLLPQIGGYVRKILIRPGQEVKAGQVMVEVDAREERAALESSQAQQNSASTNLDLAQRTLVRTESLYKEGLVTAQELDRVQANVKAAEAAVKASSAQVSQSRVALGFHEVRAPIAGLVGDVLVRVGDYVTATTQLTSVTQGEVLEVSVTVPAERARTLSVGTPVEVLDANGAVLLASTFYFIAPQANERTQLVDARAIFDNSVGLRPNELVRTRIVFGTREALQVPALAIVRQSGQPFVFALQKGDKGTVVARRPVTLGPLGEQNYVVESGLSPGDQIAVSSLQALRDGAPVKPKPPSTASRP
jgi:RND family efflux transporter MFP subunit